jgi:hypothetical protein
MLTTLLVSGGVLFTAFGGLWIAALFLPAVATLLAAALNFAKSPIGMVLAIAALAFFAFSSGWVGGDIHGTSATKAEWKADTDARVKAEALREAKLLSDMKATAGSGWADDLVFSKSIDGKVQTYVAETPIAACRRATSDDVRRLLSIH